MNGLMIIGGILISIFMPVFYWIFLQIFGEED